MRRLHRVTGALASVALLAACGGAPEASPPPSASATPRVAPTASPSPSPPQVPDDVRTRDEAGAFAATEAFIAAQNYAGRTGDTSHLRRTYVSSCTRCEAVADGVDDTYAAGGRITGGDWIVRDLEFHGQLETIGYVDATVDFEPQTWVRAATAEPEVYGATENVLKAFQLRWRGTDQGWAIAALDPEG